MFFTSDIEIDALIAATLQEQEYINVQDAAAIINENIDDKWHQDQDSVADTSDTISTRSDEYDADTSSDDDDIVLVTPRQASPIDAANTFYQRYLDQQCIDPRLLEKKRLPTHTPLSERPSKRKFQTARKHPAGVCNTPEPSDSSDSVTSKSLPDIVINRVINQLLALDDVPTVEGTPSIDPTLGVGLGLPWDTPFPYWPTDAQAERNSRKHIQRRAALEAKITKISRDFLAPDDPSPNLFGSHKDYLDHINSQWESGTYSAHYQEVDYILNPAARQIREHHLQAEERRNRVNIDVLHLLRQRQNNQAPVHGYLFLSAFYADITKVCERYQDLITDIDSKEAIAQALFNQDRLTLNNFELCVDDHRQTQGRRRGTSPEALEVYNTICSVESDFWPFTYNIESYHK